MEELGWAAYRLQFVGDQLHGYESRLTSDICPADYGWAVNWEKPDRRLEWYHNASSIEQAGPIFPQLKVPTRTPIYDLEAVRFTFGNYQHRSVDSFQIIVRSASRKEPTKPS